ncbi:MFS transporter [Gorillibacterium massiliense]|uniref:MFS transporter n=1 Tax=Gorillibacterium massiliense TaxID=1280390 RepID=UPI0004B0F0FB|nr:MFS transporter [Gorillibacterium massiliense]
METAAVVEESLQEPGAGRGYRELFAIRDYVRLIVAQLVSDIGDGVYYLALVWLMKILTGSGLYMSLMLAAESVPVIIVGLFSGVVVDMRSKRRIMLLSDGARFFLIAGLSVAVWLDVAQPWMLIASGIVLSSFSAFFNPCRTVAVKSIVPEELMIKATSLAQTLEVVTGFSAPALAAGLILLGIPAAFLFDAATFAFSFILIWRIGNPDMRTSQTGKINTASIRQGLAQGLRTIASVALLRNLIVYLVILNAILAPFSLLFPLYVDDAYKLSLGQIFFMAGILLGAVAAASGFLGKVKRWLVVVGGIVLIVAGFSSLAFIHSFYLALFCLPMAGVGVAIVNVTLEALFIVKVPQDVLGTASSMLRVLLQSAKPLSLLIAGGLLSVLSVRQMFLVLSLSGILLVVMLAFNRSIRSEDSPPAQEA